MRCSHPMKIRLKVASERTESSVVVYVASARVTCSNGLIMEPTRSSISKVKVTALLLEKLSL